MPRRARLLSESGIYHIMVRGNEKKEIFVDDEDRARSLEIIMDKAYQEEVQILSYCLMSNHIHLLVMQKNAQIGRFMKRVEVSYAYYFNKKHGRIGHLFQDRYKSETIDSNEHLLAAVRYIHKNPVKAGIVKSEGDYEWSSFNAYTRDNTLLPSVNIEYILGMFAKERKRAIKLFKEFSGLEGNEDFMDVGIDGEKDNREIKGVMASRKVVDEILTSRGLKLEHLRLKQYNEIRNEIISLLKRKSDLSIRQIAELLEINRGVIQRIK
ncbi:MAG: transposase [Clostridiaceae bacterium]|nr:transposase [Clostridiaceae bacterium]